MWYQRHARSDPIRNVATDRTKRSPYPCRKRQAQTEGSDLGCAYETRWRRAPQETRVSSTTRNRDPRNLAPRDSQVGGGTAGWTPQQRQRTRQTPGSPICPVRDLPSDQSFRTRCRPTDFVMGQAPIQPSMPRRLPAQPGGPGNIWAANISPPIPGPGTPAEQAPDRSANLPRWRSRANAELPLVRRLSMLGRWLTTIAYEIFNGREKAGFGGVYRG